jgi:putative restriction endonuclease
VFLHTPQDIFRIGIGDTVTKRNLYDLVQYSKVDGSPYWGGEDFHIGNTPQQGINWIGAPPRLQGVIIKTRHGSYEHDGWLDAGKNTYRYSFKARKSKISYAETANRVLIAQPQHAYPIFLFTEHAADWVFEGQFSVAEIDDAFVVLSRYTTGFKIGPVAQDDIAFEEGGRRYVTHLLAERSREVVDFLKSNNRSVCDICAKDYTDAYGVKYIEAHHKIPISTFTSKYVVRPVDLALLCPNCHRAVHIYMKNTDDTYEEIRRLLQDRMRQKSA